MQWLARGKARGVAVAVALVVVAVASSCGGPGGGGGGGSGRQAAPKPIITPKQAVSVVKNLDSKRVQAIDATNGPALTAIEIEPQLTFDQEGLQSLKDQGDTTEYPSDVSVMTLVPKQTTYPAWFMAQVHLSNGQTTLALFTCASKARPWQLMESTRLFSPVPWKQERGGWAVPGQLNTDPSRTLSDYWNAAVGGTADPAGAGVASGTMTSDIASQIESKIATNKSRGWAQIAVFAAGGTLPEAVALTNGGSLSFAWVTEQLKTRDAYPYCFSQPASNGSKWDPLVPNGSYLEVDLTYTYMEAMVTPRTGDLGAVSYATGTTGVNVTPCSS